MMGNGMNRAACDMIIGARTVSRKMDLKRPILMKNVLNPHRIEI
jgi:hypothetical protein